MRLRTTFLPTFALTSVLLEPTYSLVIRHDVPTLDYESDRASFMWNESIRLSQTLKFENR